MKYNNNNDQHTDRIISYTGNVFIGWGGAAAYSEFSADSSLLCDGHFGASAFFTFGRVTSYRVYKDDWVGKPLTGPDATLVGN
jgi:hypothetical protein